MNISNWKASKKKVEYRRRNQEKQVMDSSVFLCFFSFFICYNTDDGETPTWSLVLSQVNEKQKGEKKK